ncbi:DUF6515 family protein [Marinifilum caeruleilacunae]|uniref:Uncharacterized protein n=1 Tax=Marinifilum caeruleilacunae TaxID=2499076 RepID=A0ABX1WTE8_9BACT|nr:DUF6515 family protein [Marinifilum caeruleilacunae]NOU59370.1 hypothetical protein [Marinifilum caeruleilacunae]
MKYLVKILLVLFLISGGILMPERTEAKQVYKKVVVKHKRYKRYPAKGTTVLYVNSGKRIKHHKGVFYHANGIYYRKSTRGYKIVAAPVGVRVKVLPAKHVRIVLNGRNYFYHYGTYYIAVGKRYEVVAPPVGIQVDDLPNGYKLVSKKGRTFYVVDGVFYKRIVLKNGARVFQVVRVA